MTPSSSLRKYTFLLWVGSALITAPTSFAATTNPPPPPAPPPGYYTGGLFMKYWENLTEATPCKPGEAIVRFDSRGDRYATPICEKVFNSGGISTSFGDGMTGTLNRLLKYTPDGEHAGDSALYESGGKVGIGIMSPTHSLETLGDILIHGALLGLGSGGLPSNIVVGMDAFLSNVSGEHNSVFGEQSLKVNTSGGGNTAIGASSLITNTFGNNNTALGYLAGDGLTSGSNNIFIGYNTPPNISPVASNQLNIGNWIFGHNGNIGIGVKNPTHTFEVAGDANFSSGICIDGDCKNDWRDVGPWRDTGGGISYTGGKVAIGQDTVTSNTYNLDVAGGYINSNSGYCISGDCKSNWNDVGYWKKVGGILSYTGNTSVGENFTIGKSLIVGNDLSVSGSEFIGGNLNTAGSINASGNINTSGSLNVTGDIHTFGDMNTDGNITSEKYINTKMGLCINGDCKTNWNQAGPWSIIGPSTVYYSGDVNIGRNMKVEGSGDIFGDLHIRSNLSTSGSTTIQNNLWVGGTTNLSGDTNIGGDMNIGGNLTVTGSSYVGGDSYVSGNISSSGYINAQSGYCLGGNCVNQWADVMSGTLSGTYNYLTKFTPDGHHLGDSAVYESGGRVGIGTSNPHTRLEISGTLTFGDYGPWASGSTIRNWLGICYNCNGTPADSTTGYNVFHISGVSNDNFGTGIYGIPRRVIGLYDTVLISDLLGVGRALPPRASLDVNGDALINDVTVGRGSGNIVSNTVVGNGALNGNTTGYQNVGFGYHTFQSNTTGINNSAFGASTLAMNTTGSYNTAVGIEALNVNTVGAWNTAVGAQTLHKNTTGIFNTANGANSLSFNTIGFNNTANGTEALYSNVIGNYNTANGSLSLRSNVSGSWNTANGVQSLYQNSSGSFNTANGVSSLYSNTLGNGNSVNGTYTLYSNTTGFDNTANGISAMRSNTNGYRNTANGMYSLYSNTTGNYNVADGARALYLNINGNYNTSIGVDSGSGFTSGNNNIFIGYNTQPNISTTASNQLNIGNWIYGYNGNIGVGVLNPGYKLDIASGYVNSASGYCIAGDCRPSWNAVGGNNIAGTLNYLAKYTPDGTHIGNSQIFDNGTNVGIGTATPGVKLDINGNTQVSGTLNVTNSITDMSGTRMDANGGWFRTYGPTGWYNQTYGGGWNMTDTTWIRAYGSKSVWTDQVLGAQAGLTIGYGGTSAPVGGAIINGRVGIKTSNPQAGIEVNDALGIMLNNGNVDGSRVIWKGGTSGIQEYRARVGTNGTLGFFPIEAGFPGYVGTSFALTQGGNVLVGNYTGTYTPTEKLEVNGNVLAQAYLYSSDKRLKKDIIPLDSSLEKILSLRGYAFTWKESGKQDIGIIAQEVEKVFPEIVHTASGSDGYKSVEYGNLIAPVIEAIREVYTQVTSQRQQLDYMKAVNRQQAEKIHDLEARLERVEMMLSQEKR